MRVLAIAIAALLSTAAAATEDFGSQYWRTVAVKVGVFEAARTLCPLRVDAETSDFIAGVRGQVLANSDLLIGAARASSTFRDDWRRDPIAACSTVQADVDGLATAKLPAKR